MPERQQQVPPPLVDPAVVDAGNDSIEPEASHDKFSLHPDNPANFLKLSAAL